jgi:hypothetical protein
MDGWMCIDRQTNPRGVSYSSTDTVNLPPIGRYNCMLKPVGRMLAHASEDKNLYTYWNGLHTILGYPTPGS